VDLVNAMDDARAVYALTIVAYDLPKGCCASYYPETQPLIALDDRDEAARPRSRRSPSACAPRRTVPRSI
jgi:hypothetical protein